jgi:FtsZ-binding cell division protein ZapB
LNKRTLEKTISSILLEIPKIKETSEAKGNTGKSTRQKREVLSNLKEELTSAKINFKWQTKSFLSKLEDLKSKANQLVKISTLPEEKQLKVHFIILILNYLISNNLPEELVIKLGTYFFTF